MSTPEDSASSALPPHEALRALRARAEERRHLVTQSVADKSPAEVQRLVQELQVHQIELEMQYEELLLAQAEAETVRAQYVDLYDFAPVGYCTLDAHGLILLLNLSAARLLGTVRQRLMGRRFPLFVARADQEKFVGFLVQVLQADHRQTCELEMLREDGTAFWAQLKAVAVAVGSARQCRLAIIDITAQRQATRALAASEARFRRLFEDSNDAVVLLQGSHYVDCNAAALRLLGARHKHEIVGHLPTAFTPERQPDGQLTADLFQQTLAAALMQGSRRCEACMYRLTGEEIWVEAVLTPVAEEGGVPLIHVLWRDITTTRRVAERLRASEEQRKLALTASGTGTFTWHFATDVVQWDEHAQAAFGHCVPGASVPLQTLLHCFHPADLAAAEASTLAAIASRRQLTLHYRVVWPDGSVHYLSSAGQVLTDARGHSYAFAGVLRDVTAQYEAEQELSYKNLLVQRMLETMPVVLARLQPDGRYLEALGQGLSSLGLTTEALADGNALETFAAARDQVERLLAGEQVEFDNAIEHDGRQHYFHTYGFFDEQRRQATLFAIDVTEVEEQKKRLRAEKEFSESLLDNSVDGIMAFDQHGRFLAWNRVLERHTGRLEADLLGQDLFAAFPEWRSKVPAQAIRQVLKGKRMTRYNLPFHGQPGHYESHLVPLLGADNAVNGGLVLIRDVTERVQLAEESTRLKLRQQQEVLSAILATQEEERRRIAEALHNGVGQLLYAAKLNLEHRIGNVAVYRATALSLLNDAIRATRTISFELTPGILEDFGLRIALEELAKRIPQQNLRIRLNLVGLEKPRPSLLEIAIYRVVQELLNNIIKHAQASEAFIHVVHEGPRMHISVEDNGTGISPDQAKIPLSGIGLAGIRTRIDLLGGEFSIASRIGSGTIITIELPAER